MVVTFSSETAKFRYKMADIVSFRVRLAKDEYMEKVACADYIPSRSEGRD
jgi:hypothetical protein